MEDSYVIDNTPMTATGLTGLSPFALNRLARYQGRVVEETAMATLDIQANMVIASSAIAAHASIVGLARQASEAYPEAADRFQSLAVQDYCNLSNIIDDYARRR